MSDALAVGNPAIEVRLRRNRRARRMVLRVGRAGRPPTLTLPPGVPVSRASAFLADHEGWLRRQIACGPPPQPVRDGFVLPYRDGRLTVRVHDGPQFVLAGDVLLVPGPAAVFPVRVAAWLREAARTECVEGVVRDAARLGLGYGRVSLRDPRSRWGSCTTTGDLMFSWRLIMAPAFVLDYVVSHEVAHLAEMNHSSRFWRVVDRLCPESQAPRAWLRQHGAGLHAFDFTPG